MSVNEFYIHPMSQKSKTTSIFMKTLANVDQFSVIFFTVKFRNELQKKPELKLSPLLKSVAVLFGEK